MKWPLFSSLYVLSLKASWTMSMQSIILWPHFSSKYKKIAIFFAQTRWNVSWWKSWAIIQAILWISYFVRQKSRFIFLRQTQCKSKPFWSCIGWLKIYNFTIFFLLGILKLFWKYLIRTEMRLKNDFSRIILFL